MNDPIPRSARIKSIQRKALILLVISGSVSTIDRAALSVANPLIRRDLGLSIEQMGLLLSAFLGAYALSQLPLGAVIDRFGPRRLLSCALGLWSLAQLAGGFVTGATSFFIARMFLGVGEAPQFPTAGRVVRDWFAVRDRVFATGIFSCASTLGTGLAAPLLTGMMLNFGWRWMFVIMGVIGITVAIIWGAIYRDPADVPLTEAENAYRLDGVEPGRSTKIGFREWGKLFRHATTWGLLLGFFGVIYVNWFFNAWLPGYLEIERHMSVTKTGWTAAIPYSFAVIGALSAGFLVDWMTRQGFSPINARKIPFCVNMVVETAFIVIAAYAPSDTLAIICLSGAMFCGAAATTYAWALVTTVGPASCTGTLGSLQTFGGYVGGACAPIVTGYLVQTTGSFLSAMFMSAAMALFAMAAYVLLVRRPIVIQP